MDGKSMLTVSEAAAFLCVRVATLYAWVHQGRITHRKHGRKLVFSMEDLAEWSRAQIVPASSSPSVPVFTVKPKQVNPSSSSLKTKKYGAKDHRRTAVGGDPFEEEGGTS